MALDSVADGYLFGAFPVMDLCPTEGTTIRIVVIIRRRHGSIYRRNHKWEMGARRKESCRQLVFGTRWGGVFVESTTFS